MATTEPGAAPEVRLMGGPARGTWESGLQVFRGIPYAAPPVGVNRFAAPQPARAWEGVRPATAFGPPPPQPDALGRGRAELDAGDEWLTVNVWTPAADPAAALPVMVWIQGGAYVVGDAGAPEFDGARLAGNGGVVLVSFNYRLGIEGFAHIEGAPPNRGLLDQIAALRWVHDEISAFGGDPEAVTIFGESAGGGSVASLLVMPAAAGLFQRAIAQSVPGTCFSLGLAADIAATCAAELSARPTIADLAAVDPIRLADASQAVTASALPSRWGPAGYRSILFAPVVDGVHLPCTPWQGLAAGASRHVPLLAGHTRDEHRLFALLSGTLGRATEADADLALRTLAPGPDGAGRYRAAYPDAGPNELHELVHSDWLFRMPSVHLAEAHTAGGGRSYCYELTWPAPGLGGVLGACHGLDVPLVFGNLSSGRPAVLIGEHPDAAAEALSERMRSAWTAFAARGDPGWPAYDPDERLTRTFDTSIAVQAYPEDRSSRIWQGHEFAALDLVDGPASG